MAAGIFSISRSRYSFARIEAAEMHGSLASPPTIGRVGQRHSDCRPAGVRLPSTSTWCGSQPITSHSRATAWAIAHIVAWKMLIADVLDLDHPDAERAAAADALSSSARRSCVSFFESSSPRVSACTEPPPPTGPPAGPRPASSTPTTSPPAANEAAKSQRSSESMRRFGSLPSSYRPQPR
jgi:hypothetical protein